MKDASLWPKQDGWGVTGKLHVKRELLTRQQSTRGTGPIGQQCAVWCRCRLDLWCAGGSVTPRLSRFAYVQTFIELFAQADVTGGCRFRRPCMRSCESKLNSIRCFCVAWDRLQFVSEEADTMKLLVALRTAWHLPYCTILVEHGGAQTPRARPLNFVRPCRMELHSFNPFCA